MSPPTRRNNSTFLPVTPLTLCQLARPKMKAVDRDTVFRLVEENAKKRFELVFGYDPSQPKPKKKQQPKKKKPAPVVPGSSQVDAVAAQLAQTAVTPAPPPPPPAQPEWKELDFVTLPAPEAGSEAGPSEPRGEWFIRATQGHSIKLEGTAHLEPVLADEAGRAKAGLLVHGTQWKLWATLKETGLSKMARQHVHLAPALKDHRILPRNNSTLLIFLDLDKMLAAEPPIPVFAAANGVILTPGDKVGIVAKEYWRKAVHLEHGKRIVVWEGGKEVEREEREDEE